MRRSPVRFDAIPIETERRDGWEVVLSYGDQGDGPWLVDLSHRNRWDVQDREIERLRPFGLPVPEAGGGALIERGLLIARLNRTQVAVTHLGAGPAPATPEHRAFTPNTDAHCALGLFGCGTAVAGIVELLTPVDLFPAGRPRPFLTQGPILGVPSRIVTLAPDGLVFTVARGYGRTLATAVLELGAPAGLAPAGERVFTRWMAERS